MNKPRTLRDLLEDIRSISRVNSAYLDLPIIYAKDDEGNEYQAVHYSPTLGKMNDGYFEDTGDNPTVICIN